MTINQVWVQPVSQLAPEPGKHRPVLGRGSRRSQSEDKYGDIEVRREISEKLRERDVRRRELLAWVQKVAKPIGRLQASAALMASVPSDLTPHGQEVAAAE